MLARVFAARGVTTTEELDTRLAQLPSSSLLMGIDAAAARLADAIAGRERILVIADYDADGATACAVAVRGLAAMGAVVDFLVPNRFDYGYGLTPEIVVEASTREPRLIVTVDNGIASHDGVAEAAARGIEVLITDHHLPAATLPAPALIVNPNQPGCAFPCKHLAGVGVMFFVLMATRALLRERGAFAGRDEPNLARAARSRRARHGRRCRAPRQPQPHAGRAGTCAHSRRARVSRGSPRSSPLRAATCAGRAPTISASSPDRASMRRDGSPT